MRKEPMFADEYFVCIEQIIIIMQVLLKTEENLFISIGRSTPFLNGKFRILSFRQFYVKSTILNSVFYTWIDLYFNTFSRF